MNVAEIKAELLQLRKEIRYHNKKYYNDDAPEISDYEYDKLMRRLREIETAYPEFITPTSPTQTVGGTARRTAGKLVRHDVPMLSLQDVFSREEVEDFVNDVTAKLGKVEFVVEEKIDGLSLALRYVDGVLTQAVTRGDGIVQGEDVTENARVIDDVVQKLVDAPAYLEIRGEVYMTKENFDAVNARQAKLGLKTFANPRNCAAGTLRQLDSRVVAERHLSMFTFNLQKIDGVEISSHTQAYEFMARNGIRIIRRYRVCTLLSEVLEEIENIASCRAELPYPIDGAVVKVNDFAQREILGATSKFPRWAVAYKYPPDEKETVLRRIELSVGRTGRITPTAVFDPILLNGTRVERATLHNQDFIDAMDIRVGDTIRVYKSGEIIPRVSGVNFEKRPAEAVPFKIPEDFIAEENAIVERSILNFVGRSAMDIKGLGENAVADLIRAGFIAGIADIYRLHERRAELIARKILGLAKNTDKVLAAIEDSKKNPPVKLLTGLGILGVGSAAARDLIQHFGSIEKIASATAEELQTVPDIGGVTAKNIIDFFTEEANRTMIDELKKSGLTMEETVAQDTGGSDEIRGKVFVLTGKLERYKRAAAEKIITDAGGIAKSSVTKATNYVIVGEDAGSKLTKAKELGVKILSEADFEKMFGVE